MLILQIILCIHLFLNDQTILIFVAGGGIIGCSTLYHLTKLGVQNVILLEKDQLTAGTTWHTAGFITITLF